MVYFVNDFGDVFSRDKDFGANLFAGSGLTVESYHLKKDTTLMENMDNTDLVNGCHVISYLVIRGKMEFRLESECVQVTEGQSIVIYMDQNFSSWAMEETDLFAIHNCVEPDIDLSPQALVEAVKEVEKADAYLEGHNYRVGKYSTLIMQLMAPEKSTAKFHMAAAYHDVGKAIVSSEILNKPGKLTDEEFNEVKKHPVESYQMLLPILGEEAANFARWHHEKLDGSGYPDEISGDAIPLESRVIAVADVFDALTTDRSYRSGFSFHKALAIMEQDVTAGKLDAKAFSALCSLIQSGAIVEGVDNILRDANSMVHYDGFTLADLRKSLAISGTGMWKLEYDGQTYKFYGDEIMNELLGVPDSISPEERFTTFMKRVNPEDMPKFRSYMESLRRERSEIIYRYDHPELGTIYVRCGGKRDETITEKACYLGFHQNINATVRVEQEKRRQFTQAAEIYQMMSSKLMENFTTAAMTIDLQEKNFTWLSCKDQRVRNIEQYGEVGRVYASFMPEEYAKRFLETASFTNLRKVLAEQAEYSFQTYVYNEEGELRRITMWYYAVDEDRRYVLGVTKDTTEDYRKEQELAQALLAADEANRAKSVFLNNMSHDIRTPMNAIIGFKDLAIKHVNEPEKCLDYLSKIGISSEHLLSLINDVLDMSRIESGKMKIVDAPATISEIVDGLETIFSTGAAEKGINLLVHADNIANDFVLCDKLRVNQVLLNCISNAIKFTPTGGKVELAVTQLPGKNDGVGQYQFVVSDTGIGMSEKFVKTIFEPFTREDDGEAHQIQGTGLGMSICKNLVDLMNGTVVVTSKKGEGSQFTIVLPLAIDTESKAKDADTGASNQPEEEISLAGKRILLVEDNELNREIATEILEETGASIESVENGKLAVDAVAGHEACYYDCVLMDVQMPVMNGYEATAAIRGLDRIDAKDLIIIAMTANAFEEDRQRAIEAGMNDHVAKPVEVSKLMEVLAKFLL